MDKIYAAGGVSLRATGVPRGKEQIQGVLDHKNVLVHNYDRQLFRLNSAFVVLLVLGFGARARKYCVLLPITREGNDPVKNTQREIADRHSSV